MKTKFYNSEVRELAKRIFERMAVSDSIDNATVNDIAEMSIKNATLFVDALIENNLYDSDSDISLTEYDEDIIHALNTEVTYDRFGARVYCVLNYCVNIKSLENREPIVADIIRVGKTRLREFRGFGKQSIYRIEEFFENNGLSWDTNIKKYGF